MSFKAVLWDCDGCLIDSEWVACDLSAKLFTQLGYIISTEDFITRFCGKNPQDILDTVQRETGTDFSPLLDALDRDELQREAFRNSLKTIDGIEDVLSQINLPMAVVSGSNMDRLVFTLKLTNLYDRFDGSIYSSAMVVRGKPHPDVYLYAASKLKIDPKDCLVIEDSISGATSGKAAGMTVFGFTGGSHVSDKQAHRDILMGLGADLVFHDMRDLPKLMNI